ncbi:MAG TPA: F0F1 ATP synthase subunit delta [Vitreimonas sp.]|nr:F0F1 ATP synthase subunit delta [Vitreimonas sp.]
MLTVTITSAIELTAKQLESIQKAVQKKYSHQEISYQTEVDPGVIGGISIRIGSLEFDGTLKQKFAALRQGLKASL